MRIDMRTLFEIYNCTAKCHYALNHKPDKLSQTKIYEAAVVQAIDLLLKSDNMRLDLSDIWNRTVVRYGIDKFEPVPKSLMVGDGIAALLKFIGRFEGGTLKTADELSTNFEDFEIYIKPICQYNNIHVVAAPFRSFRTMKRAFQIDPMTLALKTMGKPFVQFSLYSGKISTIQLKELESHEIRILKSILKQVAFVNKGYYYPRITSSCSSCFWKQRCAKEFKHGGSN